MGRPYIPEEPKHNKCGRKLELLDFICRDETLRHGWLASTRNTIEVYNSLIGSDASTTAESPESDDENLDRYYGEPEPRSTQESFNQIRK
ncbi:hypothetical protein BGZ70_003136 [Mortierella alpina]|uniref:Uncharacterized protein n=1 Tax=Mortierella alpina TaxID=64518 RepID=A0A9P6IUQ1_MORAP|nr:hypothetical protein BGZ70_003136 [Mortierella alpina]